MSESDGVPNRQMNDGGSRGFGAERELDEVHRKLRDISNQLLEGNRTNADFRTRHEATEREALKLRAEMDMKLLAITLSHENQALSAKRSMEMEIAKEREVDRRAAAQEIETVRNIVMPRATPAQIAKWVLFIFAVLASPVGSALYFKHESVDPAVIRDLDARLNLVQGRLTEIGSRLGVTITKGTPP